MATTIIFLPRPLPCIFFLSFTSTLFTLSSSSSSSYMHQRLLQSNSPQNIEAFFPYETTPAFASPSNSLPSSLFNQPSETPISPTTPPKFLVSSQQPTKPSGSTKAVVATAACTVVVAGVFFFFLQKFVLTHRGVGQSDESQKAKLRDDDTSASINPSKLLNGNLKGMIIDEHGLDVLYWRKLEGGGGGNIGNELCREVLGPRKQVKRDSGEAVLDSNYDHVLKIQSYVNSSSKVFPESRDTVCISSPPSPSSKYCNYYTRTASEPRNLNRCSSHLSAESLNSLSPTQMKFKGTKRAFSLPSSNYSKFSPRNRCSSHLSAESLNSLSPTQMKFKGTKRAFSLPSSNYSKFSPRIRPETGGSNRMFFPGSKVTAANSMTMAMARARIQASIPPSPPPKSEPRQSSPFSPLSPAAAVNKILKSPLAIKNSMVPLPTPRTGGMKPLQYPSPSKGKTSGIKMLEPSSMYSLKQSSVGQIKPNPHWDKVIVRPEHSMALDAMIGSGSYRSEDDPMDGMFGYVSTSWKSTHVNKNSTKTTRSNSSRPTQTFLLDPHKLHDINATLQSLALSPQEILDALLNGSYLSPNTLKKLTEIVPTNEEEAMILEFSGNPLKLTDVEYFLYHLMQIIASPFIRLDAMLFRSTFESEILLQMELLQTLESACKELRPRKLFLKLLGATLRASSHMNSRLARDNAQQFNLAALNKISKMKSADRKTTLLHLAVEEVVRSEGKHRVITHDCSLGQINDVSSPREDREKRYMILGLPIVGGLSIEFSNVKKAAMIGYDGFISIHAALIARLSGISQFIGVQHLDGGDMFVREMEGFMEVAEEELKVVKEEELRVMELVKRTAEYYQVGAHIDRDSHPLQVFIIVKDFLGMIDQVCIDIARSQQPSRKPESPPKRTSVRFQNLEAHYLTENSHTSSHSHSYSSDYKDGF